MITKRAEQFKLILWIMSFFLLITCSEQTEKEGSASPEMLALSQLITINNLKVSDSLKIILSGKTLQEYSITPSQMSTYLKKNPQDAQYWRTLAEKLKKIINKRQEEQKSGAVPKKQPPGLKPEID